MPEDQKEICQHDLLTGPKFKTRKQYSLYTSRTAEPIIWPESSLPQSEEGKEQLVQSGKTGDPQGLNYQTMPPLVFLC